MNKKNLKIVIFRNNLRIEDNYALYHALNEILSCEDENIVCIYSLQILEGENLGFKKCADFRRKFIYESILELKQTFDENNISFYCVKDIEKNLQTLEKTWNIKIFYEKEVGVEELAFESILEKYPCKSSFTQTLIEPFKIDVSKSFSNFRNKVEKALKNNNTNLTSIKPSLKVKLKKQKQKLDVKIENKNLKVPNVKLILKGGEKSANERVNYYLENYLHDYFETRSLVDGFNNSTKFSAYLAIGCISPRTIYFKLKEYEAKSYESKSSYWIFFELLWRDYFHLVMLQTQNKLFLKKGLLERELGFKSSSFDMQNFFDANTGVDIIDAGIIELKTTGWISNRLRQILASYFVKNLGLDFRYGAAFFEEYLLDYSPASNWGNWAYQAGVGNDTKYRVFDPVKQSKMYGGCEYIKKVLGKEETLPLFDYKKMALKVKEEIFKLH